MDGTGNEIKCASAVPGELDDLDNGLEHSFVTSMGSGKGDNAAGNKGYTRMASSEAMDRDSNSVV